MASLIESFLASEGPSDGQPAATKEIKKEAKKEEIKSSVVQERFDSQLADTSKTSSKQGSVA